MQKQKIYKSKSLEKSFFLFGTEWRDAPRVFPTLLAINICHLSDLSYEMSKWCHSKLSHVLHSFDFFFYHSAYIRPTAGHRHLLTMRGLGPRVSTHGGHCFVDVCRVPYNGLLHQETHDKLQINFRPHINKARSARPDTNPQPSTWEAVGQTFSPPRLR